MLFIRINNARAHINTFRLNYPSISLCWAISDWFFFFFFSFIWLFFRNILLRPFASLSNWTIFLAAEAFTHNSVARHIFLSFFRKFGGGWGGGGCDSRISLLLGKCILRMIFLCGWEVLFSHWRRYWWPFDLSVCEVERGG